jgi:hypothetical protein
MRSLDYLLRPTTIHVSPQKVFGRGRGSDEGCFRIVLLFAITVRKVINERRMRNPHLDNSAQYRGDIPPWAPGFANRKAVP